MELILHGYWRSSSSWRVRIALNWKGLDYAQLPVHLVADGGQQHGPAHRAVNPMREVPVLSIDRQPLAQSIAILEYLEETCPDPPLLPRDPLGRARVRQMTEIINSGIQPVQNLRVLQRLGREFGLDPEQREAWARDWIDHGLQALDVLTGEHGGRYAFGDQVSFVDLCLVPQLYNARRFRVELDRYPRLLQLEDRLASLSAFQRAHPSQQPDALAS